MSSSSIGSSTIPIGSGASNWIYVPAFERWKKILSSDCLTVLPVLDLYPGRRFRRVLGVCLFRDNPSMSRSQITPDKSVPLAKCCTYTSALGLRGSSFRRRVFRSERAGSAEDAALTTSKRRLLTIDQRELCGKQNEADASRWAENESRKARLNVGLNEMNGEKPWLKGCCCCGYGQPNENGSGRKTHQHSRRL